MAVDYAGRAARELRETARRKGYRTSSKPDRFPEGSYRDESLPPVRKVYSDGTAIVVSVRVFRPLEKRR